MLKIGALKDKLVAVLSLLIKQRKVRRGSAAILFLLLTTAIISPGLISERSDIILGQVSSTTIKAEKSIVFEDKDKTDMERSLASEKAEKIYTRDSKVSLDVQNDISDLAGRLAGVQRNTELELAQKVAMLKEIFPFAMQETELNDLAQFVPEDTEYVESVINNLIAEAMDEGDGITQDILDDKKKEISNIIIGMRFSKAYEIFARSVVEQYLRSNSFINYDMTKQMQEEAMNAVAPVMISIKEGEKIIGEGEIITEEHLAKLQALGVARPEMQVTSLLGSLLLVVLLTGLVLVYLYQQNREIYENHGHLYLLGIIVFMVLLVGKAIIAIDVARWPEFSAQFGYMIPLATAGMLIAILLDSRLALLVVAVLCLLQGVMTDNQLRFAIVGMAGGMAGVYSVSKLSQRGDLVRAGAYISITNIVVILIVGLVNHIPLGVLIFSGVAMGVANGILSSVLTNGALPFLESTFRLTSPVRLLEYSHPNNVLLKRLLTEAPGTYHHSIIVGNLAEAATDAVGGDSLLVRVGAYYHDIGKIKRPFFFIENQLDCENPHNKIGPSLSTLIITSHVKDGVDLAREHKLPQGIIDIIEQHHGNSLVSYFYHKALENDRTESVTEEEFRYEGIKPQTREAAIVMLADSVEAAIRSLQNRTPARTEGLVRKFIKDKLNDGQLDECDLTFKDLDIIANAFVRVLSGIFHSRIEYPDLTQEMERRKKRAGFRKQSTGKNGAG